MTTCVINADDFGYSRGVNYGIVDCHLNGVVTSTTMMANMPGLQHAAKLHKEVPTLGIGAHLSLTGGSPVRSDVDTLITETGKFRPLSYYKDGGTIDLDQLYAEWKAQIERLYEVGIHLTHLDSHHYTHAFPNHRAVAERLSQEFHLPLRNCLDAKEESEHRDFYPADAFWNLFNFKGMKQVGEPYPTDKESLFEQFKKDAGHYSQYEKIEASCHPGYLDEVVWFGSSFNRARMKEIQVLCDPDFKKLLDEYGYIRTHYGNL